MNHMKTRATLIVKGDVHEAGYRAFVMKAAQKMALVGYVENLPDGSVKIISEGERGVLGKFIKTINIRNEYVDVESIEKKFEKPKGKFKRFEVKTGKLSDEMFQGYATAGKYFKLLGEKIDSGNEHLGEKIDGVGEKVDGVRDEVVELREHTDRNFDRLDEKYHVVSETLKAMNEGQMVMYEELAKTRIELTKVVDNLTLLVQSYVKGEK